MDVDDLYGLPLDKFVPQRAALAKSLRAGGRRDEAAEVAGLRKPSVAAWAVNQLIRTQRADAQELFDAGDALRDAQSDLLAGRGGGRALRAAGDRQRAAVDRLVDAARGLLTTAGDDLSPAVVERVSGTLHAAALDPDAREQVREGRLERELRHVGLGLGESPLAEPAAPKAGGRPPSESATTARTDRRRAGDDGAGAGQRAKHAGADAGEPARGLRKREAPADTDTGETARGRRKREAAADTDTGETARGRRRREAAADADANETARGRRKREAPADADTGETARDRRKREAEERAEAERAERERAAARTAARAAEAKARRRAESAARALRAAEQRREAAAESLREADEVLAAAREDAAHAEAEHEHAQAELKAALGRT